MNPAATYRIQLNKEFDFEKLRQTLPYLSELGISHVYASPITQARTGSSHGYDATDPTKISEDLGGPKAFRELCKEASALGLKWIQDIVPNHIAYSTESPIISDILKRGFDSNLHSFLDVDWNHPSKYLNKRILAPFLQHTLAETIGRDELRLDLGDGLEITYQNQHFPLKITSYKNILNKTNLTITLEVGNEDLPRELDKIFKMENKAKRELEHALNFYNENPRHMQDLLSEQIFAFSNWRTAFKEINYRRFFDQLDLICLKQEQEQVFAATHALYAQLLKEGTIDGLRVDHIDGLHDPEAYLQKLRNLAPNAYIIVEKILLLGETLDKSWPVQGTTGYDYLNKLNGLFIQRENEEAIASIYKRFSRNQSSYENLLYKCKRKVIRELFAGDVQNLARLLIQVLEKKAHGKSFSKEKANKAIESLLATFPVYRTYFNEKVRDKKDLEYFRNALIEARQRNPDLVTELGALQELIEDELSTDMTMFLMRFQQFTGAVMAKGMEDTLFYVYNRLVSLNEVGGENKNFGSTIETFHSFIKRRQKNYPSSINATATHDTKRGEDARARLNVLSENPSELSKQVKNWSQLNQKQKIRIKDKLVPNKNEEYYFYQTLIGSYPFDPEELPEFSQRMKAHMIKALREAKTNSDWLSPNQKYEEAVTEFVAKIIENDKANHFLKEFLPFQRKIAHFGAMNSLSQTLIKITSPGTPDFYQGTELWDFNMVDPDNRRQINFQKRKRLLEQTKKLKPGEINSLLENLNNGQIKLYLTYKALGARRKKLSLFQEGSYVPLKVKGSFKNHVIAYARRRGTQTAVIIAPRFFSAVAQESKFPLSQAWKDTTVYLSESQPNKWLEVFSGKEISPNANAQKGFRVSDVLTAFPVALLLTEESAP